MEFINQMNDKGWWIFPDFIDMSLIEKMREDLEISYSYCREIQTANGVNNSEGTCHHLIGQSDSFMDCLAEYGRIDSYLEEYFGGKYILNSFGGNILRKGMSYANNIHRDIRSFSGTIPLMLNTLVMLDDFTEENGATWLCEGGHRWKDKPSENEFNKHALQIIGKSGTLVIWNSNLWHRAGENKTDSPRRSVTPELTKPFIKHGFDYPQFCNDNTPSYLKQVLGYNARTPRSLNEWYQPREKRFYQDGQG